MKILLFPNFSFLYSYIETWLSNMAKKGYCLVSQKGWLWSFEKRNPCDKKYFLWLHRFKGRDCSGLACEVSIFYGTTKGPSPIVNSKFLRITEIDVKKIDENVSHYYKKRNYICFKIAMHNFFFISPFFATCFLMQLHSYLILCGILEIIFAFNFLCNLIQYIKKTGDEDRGRFWKTGDGSMSSNDDKQN